MNFSSSAVLSWLLTYGLHSTALLVLARIVTSRKMSAASRDVIWKSALVGGIVTASVQQAFDLRPSGSVALPAIAATSAQPVASAPLGETTDLQAKKGELQSEKASEVGGTANPSATPVATARLSVSDGLVLGWVIVAFALAITYGARRLILVGRLGDRRRVMEGPMLPILAGLQGNGTSTVRLTSSNAISSPVALGLNEICVPEAAITELDEEQQRGLLAHELAHLERRDPVWLDIVSVLERVFFFQPLNRMARREIQLAAEHLCDDWAATRLGSGVPLAKCLAQVAEWIQASPLGVPVAGMAEQRSQLVERIARLVDRTARAKPASRALVTVGSLALLAGMVAAAPGVQSTVREQTKKLEETSKVEETSFDLSQGRGPSPSPSSSPSGFGPGISQGGPSEEQDPAVITALIERLKDTDASVRRAAASSLGNLKGARAVPALISALEDKDKEVRNAAVQSLGNIQDSRAINPLLDLIRDPSVGVRHAVLDALGNFEHEEIPAGPIVGALADNNAEVRQKATQLLGQIRDRAAVGALMNAVRDAHPDVRASAIEALGEIRDAAATRPITAALKDENPDVRHQAVHALDHMKAPIEEVTLLDLLKDQSAEVRQAALEFAKERPFAALVPVLIKMLDDPNSDVRMEAVSALGEIRDSAARAALRGALNSKDARVRARAAEVLGERP
jgi:HEAT repeat protein/beta-lactamase regulating signal transducer with metallopeptidase domain